MERLRILLLQARGARDPMRQQELECFARHCGIDAQRFVPHDLADGPPAAGTWRPCDALMVGGAGEYYVSRGDLPEFAKVMDFFREIVDLGRPMFASCFGFHCMVQALGGRIVFEPQRMELGTYELTLSEQGRDDPLFSILPATFQAQEGHKDRAGSYPEGIPNLASSANSPLQALRIPRRPIWATQFHPELDRRTNLERFERYMNGYARFMSADQRQAAFDQFQESPETPRLLPEFLRLVFE